VDERALRGLDGADFAFAAQKALIEAQHQFTRSVILDRPEAHHQRARSGGQERAPQAKLLVAAPAQRQPGFAATEGHQFAAIQVQAEGINSIELAVGQEDRREVRGIEPVMAVRRQVDDRATLSLLAQSDDGRLLFEITTPAEQRGQGRRLRDGPLDLKLI